MWQTNVWICFSTKLLGYTTFHAPRPTHASRAPMWPGLEHPTLPSDNFEEVLCVVVWLTSSRDDLSKAEDAQVKLEYKFAVQATKTRSSAFLLQRFAKFTSNSLSSLMYRMVVRIIVHAVITKTKIGPVIYVFTQPMIVFCTFYFVLHFPEFPSSLSTLYLWCSFTYHHFCP